MSERPALLVLAGHDPSDGPAGCAGTRADREGALLASAGFPGAAPLEVATVVTAWTRQDDAGVQDLGLRAPEAWRAEAERVAGEVGSRLGALKVGLLGSRPAVLALAAWIAVLRGERPGLHVVLDPVLSSSSGARFLGAAARATLLEALGPLGVVWTPNLPEAEALTGRKEPLEAAQALLERGAAGVCLKGGHGQGDPLRDLVARPGAEPIWIESPRLPGTIRGTGCRYASALAAALALGEDLPSAAARAASTVGSAILRRRAGNPPAPDTPPPAAGS